MKIVLKENTMGEKTWKERGNKQEKKKKKPPKDVGEGGGGLLKIRIISTPRGRRLA